MPRVVRRYNGFKRGFRSRMEKSNLKLTTFLNDAYERGKEIGYFTKDRARELTKMQWLIHAFKEFIAVPQSKESELNPNPQAGFFNSSQKRTRKNI